MLLGVDLVYYKKVYLYHPSEEEEKYYITIKNTRACYVDFKKEEIYKIELLKDTDDIGLKSLDGRLRIITRGGNKFSVEEEESGCKILCLIRNEDIDTLENFVEIESGKLSKLSLEQTVKGDII